MQGTADEVQVECATASEALYAHKCIVCGAQDMNSGDVDPCTSALVLMFIKELITLSASCWSILVPGGTALYTPLFLCSTTNTWTQGHPKSAGMMGKLSIFCSCSTSDAHAAVVHACV